LDKTVAVRFYRITRSARQEMPFLQRLAEITAIPEGQRIRRVADIDFWIDKMSINTAVASGRLCRTQSNHLPPKALAGGRLEPLGVPAIGLNTVWQFDTSLSVLAIEASRNGVNLSKLLAYIRNICDCQGYGFFPVIDDAALMAAQAGRIRELSVRVATPANLETVAADQRSVKQGMVQLMGPEIATQIEIKFSVKAGEPDIRPDRFQRIVNWFRGEKGADRGTISKLKARVVADDGSANMLDLLDAHLGTHTDLDLPDDDPDRSATIRLANVARVFETHRDILHRQFGQ
jgi:hypothetical protein